MLMVVCLDLTYNLVFCVCCSVSKWPAIKKKMEKDVDEVGSIARFIKGKLEELDREVLSMALYLQHFAVVEYISFSYMSIHSKCC